ncbi:hypothetical protein [Geodermatophilus sp. URMC 62]|uniref:hypothetical protein n=1 Tax=Geodermatophilus sp. URMC 62 TaxID=3423414 RepID=UPI00406C57EE
MESTAYRYELEVPGHSSSPVLHPGRDTVTGATVSILQLPAPDGAAATAAAVDRLRRSARVRHPHLAEVRDVEVRAGVLRVVCEPLSGDLLSAPGERAMTVQTVQRLAGDALDALAALHRSGVVHGAVGGSSLLLSHRTGPTTELDVTLLPVPAGTDRPGPGAAADATAGATAGATPEDDVRAAATTFLALLDRTPRGGLDAAVLAAGLARALQRAGGVTPSHGSGDGADAEAGARAVAQAGRPAGSEPVDGRRPPERGGAGSPYRRSAPGRRGMRARHRPEPTGLGGRRARTAALALGAAAVGATAAFLAAGGGTAPSSTAAPAGGTTTTGVPATSSPAPAPVPVPRTVPGLVEDLTARPDVAGPAGPALRDALAGLLSADGAVRQQAGLQVLGLLVDGSGLDPRYATASRQALVEALTGAPRALPVPGGPRTCLRVTAGTPVPLVQGYAEQVLDRLPAWQADGLPAGDAETVRQLVTPVAAGTATLGLEPCPAG